MAHRLFLYALHSLTLSDNVNVQKITLYAHGLKSAVYASSLITMYGHHFGASTFIVARNRIRFLPRFQRDRSKVGLVVDKLYSFMKFTMWVTPFIASRNIDCNYNIFIHKSKKQ